MAATFSQTGTEVDTAILSQLQSSQAANHRGNLPSAAQMLSHAPSALSFSAALQKSSPHRPLQQLQLGLQLQQCSSILPQQWWQRNWICLASWPAQQWGSSVHAAIMVAKQRPPSDVSRPHTLQPQRQLLCQMIRRSDAEAPFTLPTLAQQRFKAAVAQLGPGHKVTQP